MHAIVNTEQETEIPKQQFNNNLNKLSQQQKDMQTLRNLEIDKIKEQIIFAISF